MRILEKNRDFSKKPLTCGEKCAILQLTFRRGTTEGDISAPIGLRRSATGKEAPLPTEGAALCWAEIVPRQLANAAPSGGHSLFLYGIFRFHGTFRCNDKSHRRRAAASASPQAPQRVCTTVCVTPGCGSHPKRRDAGAFRAECLKRTSGALPGAARRRSSLRLQRSVRSDRVSVQANGDLSLRLFCVPRCRTAAGLPGWFSI